MNLFEAIRKGTIFDVQACLKRGEPLHMVDSSGLMPLHWAAIMNRPDVLMYLVLKGADVHAKATKLQLTPLHFAAIKNSPKCVNVLLEKGAQIDQPSVNGLTAMDFIIRLNHSADSLSLLAEFMPEVKLAFELNYGFDVFVTLAKQGAKIADINQLEAVMLNALSHDRADVLQAVVERGYGITKLEEGMSLTMGGIQLPIQFALGYRYAMILAMANASISCLDYMARIDTDFYKPLDMSLSSGIERNPLIWVAQQMPEAAVLAAPLEFLDAQQEEKFSIQTVRQHLPAILKSYDPEEVMISFDTESKIYFISKITYGSCELYFDAKGHPLNLADRLEKLDVMLNRLRSEQGICVDSPDKTGDYVAKFLYHCPKQIIELFIKHGARFKGPDIHRALALQSADVIKLMIPYSEIGWENSDGLNALEYLSKVENDRLLNAMPELMDLMEEKLHAETVAQLAKGVDDCALESVTYAPQQKSYLPGFKTVEKRQTSSDEQENLEILPTAQTQDGLRISKS